MPGFDDVSFWTAADGTRLALRRRDGDGARRAALILVHGFGEHSGRYAHVVDWLAARGIATYALDQRGMGRSPGRRGHVSRFAQYLSDIVSLRKLAQVEVPGTLLLLGHSFGGLVVLRYLETAPEGIAGAIVTSPFLDVAMKVPAWKKKLATLLRDLMPSLPIPTGVNTDHLCTDPAVCDAARRDPLCHLVMTPRAYREILDAQSAVVAERHRIGVPLFFGLAGDDRIVSLAASRALAGRLTGEVCVRVYDGLFHEILNEPDRDRVFADLAPWLEGVLAKAAA